MTGGLNIHMTRTLSSTDEFLTFDFDEVSDRPGQLLISQSMFEQQSHLVRKALQNIIIMRAEYLPMEKCFSYQGYSPLFDTGNNPNRKYQAWYDTITGTLRFHPDPEIISVLSN